MQYTHGNDINYKNLYPLLINILRNWLTKLLRRFTEFSRNFCEFSGACRATPPKPKNYLHWILFYLLSLIFLIDNLSSVHSGGMGIECWLIMFTSVRSLPLCALLISGDLLHHSMCRKNHIFFEPMLDLLINPYTNLIHSVSIIRAIRSSVH